MDAIFGTHTHRAAPASIPIGVTYTTAAQLGHRTAVTAVATVTAARPR